ncbi:hypothetical protein OsI_10299 [Oryza sativa Indica Group]|uniref:Uncharacterized protein n=1 Tax=Oryza sativa subsp. indica TaxID=39946 RepID=B8APQ3_ORYSI|nr:hypothetical protein OsI_10299 [Oryza sativa Indica Group]
MATTVKSRPPPPPPPPPPHALPAVTTRRRGSSSSSPAAAKASVFLSAPRELLLVLCSLLVVAVLFVSSSSAAAAAEDGAEGSDGDLGGCLGFRDGCADRSALCFSPSAVESMLASEDDGVKEMDLVVSRDWGPPPPPSLGFRLPGHRGVVTCSSAADALITSRNGVGREDGGERWYNVASCQAPLVPDNWMRAMAGATPELDAADASTDGIFGSSSLDVEISPPVLDWGKSSLYVASMATLTVVNLNNDSALRVYEPFSTDPQFYVYGYDDLVLQPRENASVTFIFLPKLLGSSSAHLVLQTNFGGFIIQAKGMAVRSPYQLEPLAGMDVITGGRLERNLSIFNPFDDSLYVEEVAVWMSSFQGTKQSSHIVCQLGPFDESLEFTSLSSNWYTASSTEFGLPMIHIRPSEQWEVLPTQSSTVVELKLQPLSEGMVFGAICMKLRNCTSDRVDTVVIPMELEVRARTYYEPTNLVSVTFERVSSCAGVGSIISLSLRNEGTKLLRIVRVTEDNRDGSNNFEVKYLNGLILFPDTVTDIALIKYTSVPTDNSFDNCNIVVETNSSVGSSILIPCRDVISATLSYTASAVTQSDGPFSEDELSANSRTGSLGNIVEVKGLQHMKPTITRAYKADDTVLRRWRSHGTRTGISVLTDQKMLFPIVQVGSQFSKWITVHNPSLEHASMQLVLNSEEIIGQCKTINDACEHTFSSRSPEVDSTETRFGFSLSDAAITEASVGPLESALLGPIIFRPSNQCMWSSMVLIRSNISGMEWLPLQAHGGRQSIVLLEESEPVWKLEFNLISDIQNKSALSKSEFTSPLCGQHLSKEIHVKNSGDLPLQVTKVKISGADCAVDGFSVDNCKGFSLAPSESIRMLVSFKADFSSAMVQRDLELAMTTGIFIIPMTANIPVCMLDQCRKSYLRSIHWKTLIFLFGTVSVFVLVFARGVPTSLSGGSQDCYIKIHDGKGTIDKPVKPSFLQCSSKTSRSTREHKRDKETHKYPADIHNSPKRTEDKNNADEQLNTTSTMSLPPSNTVEDKVSIEAPETSGNLTIRVARDKGKRRKRKVGGAGLAAKFEVSSSHSGNSTPSSPLSPSSTPKQSWSFSGTPSELKHSSKLENGSDIEARPPSARNNHEKSSWLQTAKEQPAPPPSVTSGNPSPSPSPSPTAPTNAWRSPLLSSPSPIAPRSRAPGSNLMKDKAVKRTEGAATTTTTRKKDFTYDIWGDHFSGHLLGKAREVAPPCYKMFAASEGASNSFFAREPQALVTKPPSPSPSSSSSSSPPVTRGRGSLPSDVASGYGIN